MKFYDERNCIYCPLKETKKVPWEVNGRVAYEYRSFKEVPVCELVLVGEAPGFMEEVKERPFVHRAGNLLRSFLDEAGKFYPSFRNVNVMITNACKCKPVDPDTGRIRAPSIIEIECCRVHLFSDLKMARPKLIVALGKTAAIALKICSIDTSLKDIRGKFYFTRLGTVFVTYHPSAVLRKGKAYFEIFRRDFFRAVEHVIKKLDIKMKKGNFYAMD